MTQEQVQIEFNMADVDVVMSINPEFRKHLTIAAVARQRAEAVQRIEQEANESATEEAKKDSSNKKGK
jgi:hypothetical protein